MNRQPLPVPLIKPLAVISLALLTLACATPGDERVTPTAPFHPPAALTSGAEVADFLIAAIDARRMDYQQAALAVQHGSTTDVRKFGEQMMRDQAEMLNRLNALAMQKEVMVSDHMDESRSAGLRDLQAETGAGFDRRFIAMITLDHERDLREFTRAAAFSDPQVQDFARTWLPLIRSQLDGIRAIQAPDQQRAER